MGYVFQRPAKVRGPEGKLVTVLDAKGRPVMGDVWIAQYVDEHRKKVQRSTGQVTKAAAERWLKAVEGQIALGKVGVTDKPKEAEKTFGEALDRWLEEHSAVTLRGHRENVLRAKNIPQTLRRLPLSRVTANEIDRLRAALVNETKTKDGTKVRRFAPASVNHVLQLVRVVLMASHRWGLLTSAVPQVELVEKDETGFEYLRKDEAQAFLAWARENAPGDFALYAFSIYAGARMGESYGLTWDCIDLDRGRATIRRSYTKPTKTNKPRHVELSPGLVAILRAWRDKCPASDAGLVFPGARGMMRGEKKQPKSFRLGLAAIGVKRRVRFHDLRHTCASLLVMSGANLRFVQKQLGHASIQMTERYSHLAPDFNRGEAAKLSLDLEGGEAAKVIPLHG